MKRSFEKTGFLIIKSAFITIFCFYSFYIFAQDKKQLISDSTELANASTYFIAPEVLVKKNRKYNYPFDSIIFKDVRFDTTSIGATNKIIFLIDKNKFTYLKFAMGLSGVLNSFLNGQNPDSSFKGDEIICYIKKFRITELDSTYEYVAKKQRQLQIKSAIDAYYLHKRQMYPVFRSDTTFLQSFTENKENYFIIDSLLEWFSEKLSKIDTSRILKRRSISRENVDVMYTQRFELPILNATSLAKGVYTSKEEFFNNAPSILEYEWKPERKVNILYTKDENNQWSVTRKNVFGFCDGVHIWLRLENSFYPAFRKENTFQVIAPLLLKRMVNNQPTTIPVDMGRYTYFFTFKSKYTSIYYKDKSVYQIDMETAEFY